MDTMNRRSMLIGSGLAITLAGCADRPTDRDIAITLPPSASRPFDDTWNQGNRPWDDHPAHTQHMFDPTHTAILHLEFTLTGLKARRVHFPSLHGTTVNDWPNNKPKVVSFIKYLNGQGSSPGPHGVFPGLNNFAFDRPHHFVIYIKNKGADYNNNRPVWFGNSLLRGVYSVTRASKNESFFGAIRDSDASITNGSPNLVYIKNYYHVGDGNGHNHRPISGERLAYALKINALMASAEDSSLLIPLLIDPDTGNMGEGQPPPLIL